MKMDLNKPKFDFNIVKKQPLPKLPKRLVKREVKPKDIIQPPKPIKPIIKEKVRVISTPEVVKPVYSAKFNMLAPVIAGFLVIVIMLQTVGYVLNAKMASGVVLGSATSAYSDLDSANQSLEEQDFDSAKDKFSSAQNNLINAQNELDKFKVLIAIAPQAKSADKILRGAFFLAEAGKNLADGIQLFDELSVNSSGISTENFIGKLEQNKKLLENSLILLGHAQQNFDEAESLPEEFEATLSEAKSQIRMLNTILKDLVNLEDLFLSFFGQNPRTYLLVFQNYDELRATGGFIGTYGSLKYENGAIKSLKIESIYNLDGSLTKQIAAPGPFQPGVQKWGMRDSNWFVDFPTTAQKLLQFYEMESETADGVIAFTPQIFVELLKLVGAVEMKEYDVTLTPENFQDVVQRKTSLEYDKQLNQPKKFLHDFAPLLLDKLSNLGKEQWFSLFQILKDSFAQKHILIYSTDQNVQDKIAAMGFDGKILTTQKDYLAVFNTNLGGTKTDLDIEQRINYLSEMNNEGELINTLTIVRKNVALEPNTNFVRILVPQGSVLLDSSGFENDPQFVSSAEGLEIDPDLKLWDQGFKTGNVYTRTEADKTEFTGWVKTLANSSSEIKLKYKLPFIIDTGWLDRSASTSLLFQKQPGTISTYITGEWRLGNLKPDWASTNANLQTNSIQFNSNGRTDQYWAGVFK
jgi:hypothetical protein